MINTERLSIRRIAASDWRSIQAIWTEVRKTEYAQYDNPKDITDEEVRQRIARWGALSDSSEHMFFGVCLNCLLIGYVAFNRRESGYEMGYCFRPDFWEKGYAKESISALLEDLKLRGVTCFTAGTALQNTPSVKLLFSLGFRQVGSEKVTFYKDSQGKDICFNGGLFELKV